MIILSTVVLLLMVPLIAMQFTGQVKWSVLDFVIAALLLLATGLAINRVMSTVKRKKHRIVFSLMIIFVLLLIWAELAVGIF
jgi:hypothetical protein